MDASRWTTEQVFIYRHPVDMRSGTNICQVLLNDKLGDLIFTVRIY